MPHRGSEVPPDAGKEGPAVAGPSSPTDSSHSRGRTATSRIRRSEATTPSHAGRTRPTAPTNPGAARGRPSSLPLRDRPTANVTNAATFSSSCGPHSDQHVPRSEAPCPGHDGRRERHEPGPGQKSQPRPPPPRPPPPTRRWRTRHERAPTGNPGGARRPALVLRRGASTNAPRTGEVRLRRGGAGGSRPLIVHQTWSALRAGSPPPSAVSEDEPAKTSPPAACPCRHRRRFRCSPATPRVVELGIGGPELHGSASGASRSTADSDHAGAGRDESADDDAPLRPRS